MKHKLDRKLSETGFRVVVNKLNSNWCYSSVLLFNPSWQLSAMQLLAHSPCAGILETEKSEKTHGLR